MVGWVIPSGNITTFKLELARFSAELRIQDGARVWQKWFQIAQKPICEGGVNQLKKGFFFCYGSPERDFFSFRKYQI